MIRLCNRLHVPWFFLSCQEKIGGIRYIPRHRAFDVRGKVGRAPTIVRSENAIRLITVAPRMKQRYCAASCLPDTL